MLSEREIGKCIIIVGSGQSAKVVKDNPSLLDGFPVLAVNGAIDWIDRADLWFSLDPSCENIYRAGHQRLGTIYHAAGEQFARCPVRLWKRHSERGMEPPRRDTPVWWLWRWSAVLGLSDEYDTINSGNSAYGALGLAYHLGYEHVALIGVDGDSAARIDGTGKPKNLSHLPLLFASALPQIDVVSCEKLTGIPRISLQEWRKKLEGQ